MYHRVDCFVGAYSGFCMCIIVVTLTPFSLQFRIRSPPDMFSFLMSDLRPLRPEVDMVALEAVMSAAENAGTTK